MGFKKDELCKIANQLGLKVGQDATSAELVTKIQTKVKAAPGCVKKTPGAAKKTQKPTPPQKVTQGKMPLYQTAHSLKNASLEMLQQNMIHIGKPVSSKQIMMSTIAKYIIKRDSDSIKLLRKDVKDIKTNGMTMPLKTLKRYFFSVYASTEEFPTSRKAALEETIAEYNTQIEDAKTVLETFKLMK